MLVLSARTPNALDSATKTLWRTCAHPDVALGDVSYTLLAGESASRTTVSSSSGLDGRAGRRIVSAS
jgi:hypothetical protein